MGHRSYSEASDLTAHPSHGDSSTRTRLVSGDDHRCSRSTLQCKPMHVQRGVDAVDEHACSFGIVPTCTACLSMTITQNGEASSCLASCTMRSTCSITTRLRSSSDGGESNRVSDGYASGTRACTVCYSALVMGEERSCSADGAPRVCLRFGMPASFLLAVLIYVTLKINSGTQ